MPFFDTLEKSWTFITSLAVGITMVIGVSAVSSAPSFMLNYYKYIAGDENAKPGNEKFWQTVLTFYTVVTMVTQTIFGPTNLTTFCCRFSLRFRLIGSGLLMLVELLVILLLPLNSHVSETGAIVALMLMAFVGGFARAFFENTGYALFGPCPPIIMTALMAGVSVCGALTSLLQIIIKASMSDDFESVKKQSYIYFTIAIGIVIVTMFFVLTLVYNSDAKKYVAELRSKHGFFANIYRKRQPIIPRQQVIPFEPYPENEAMKSYNEEEPNQVAIVQEEDACEGPTTAELLQTVKLWPLIKIIYPMQFSVFLNYLITYLLFPGVMLAVDYEDAWFGTIVVAVFNLGDLLGRLSCLIKLLRPPRKWIVIGAILRLIFLPLMLLSATGGIPTRGAAYAMAAVAGGTGGFIGTLAMTYAPAGEEIKTDEARALAGQAAGVCLLFGIALGSLLQLPITLKL